jgi:hypothetical protein
VDDDRHAAAWDFAAPGGPRLVSGHERGVADGAATAGLSPPGDGPNATFDLAAGQPPAPVDGPVGPPLGWLVAATACLAGSFTLAWATSGPVLWTTGWFVGGFLCVGLLAVHTLRDSRRRTNPWYGARPAVSRLRTALVVLAAAAVCANAWRIADWASRR